MIHRLGRPARWALVSVSIVDDSLLIWRPINSRSEGKGHTFESCRVRQLPFIFQVDTAPRTETVGPPHLRK
jgi:hypothetical protein